MTLDYKDLTRTQRFIISESYVLGCVFPSKNTADKLHKMGWLEVGDPDYEPGAFYLTEEGRAAYKRWRAGE